MTRDAYELHQSRVAGIVEKPRQAQESSRISLALPFPPSVNHSHGQTTERGRYLTAQTKAFRAQVKTVCQGQGWPHITGRLRLSMILFLPDKRRRDGDNYAKQVLDALQHAAVFLDDEAVDHLEIIKQPAPVAGEGACHVTISRMA